MRTAFSTIAAACVVSGVFGAPAAAQQKLRVLDSSCVAALVDQCATGYLPDKEQAWLYFPAIEIDNLQEPARVVRSIVVSKAFKSVSVQGKQLEGSKEIYNNGDVAIEAGNVEVGNRTELVVFAGPGMEFRFPLDKDKKVDRIKGVCRVGYAMIKADLNGDAKPCTRAVDPWAPQFDRIHQTCMRRIEHSHETVEKCGFDSPTPKEIETFLKDGYFKGLNAVIEKMQKR